jgi:hypothetical protein
VGVAGPSRTEGTTIPAGVRTARGIRTAPPSLHGLSISAPVDGRSYSRIGAFARLDGFTGIADSKKEEQMNFLLKHLQKLGIRSLSDIPMYETFAPFQNIEATDARKLRTARHEHAHGKVIKALGTLVGMSVEQDSTSYGRTIGSGLNQESFQMAAMASVVEGHSGTGMDEYQTAMLAHFGGLSVGAAAEGARSILHKESHPDIDERAAHMIAIAGTIDGKQYADILARAAIDSYLDNKIGLDKVFTIVAQSREDGKKFEEFVATHGKIPADRTEIITNRNGTTTYVRIENGVKKQEITACSMCGQQGGHTKECPTLRLANENEPGGTQQPTQRRSQRIRMLNGLPLVRIVD